MVVRPYVTSRRSSTACTITNLKVGMFVMVQGVLDLLDVTYGLTRPEMHRVPKISPKCRHWIILQTLTNRHEHGPLVCLWAVDLHMKYVCSVPGVRVPSTDVDLLVVTNHCVVTSTNLENGQISE